MTVDLWIEITSICLFPRTEARSQLLPCHRWNPKLISSHRTLNFRAALVLDDLTGKYVTIGLVRDNVRKRMSHLLFSSGATADTVVNTLARSIIFNVTLLWKVLTKKKKKPTEVPGSVQLERTGGTKRKSQSQSISFQRFADHRQRSQPHSHCALVV